MALLFMESFDHFAIGDVSEKWTGAGAGAGLTVSIPTTGGRRSSGSFRQTGTPSVSGVQAYIYRNMVSGDATCVMGLAYRLSTAQLFSGSAFGCPIASIRDGGAATPQVTLRVNPNLTLSVVRGAQNGTVLGTTTVALSLNTFTYLEWKVLIHPSAGTVEVRVNGVPVAGLTGLTGLNTRNTANTSWSQIALGNLDVVGGTWSGGGGGTFDWDDVYVCDGTGPAPWNTFLGDIRVDYHFPNAAGSNNASTPGTGTDRFALVDELVPNDDTGLDYNTLVATGDKDTYNIELLKAAGSAILGLQTLISAKKADTGVATICPVLRHEGVDYDNVTLGSGPAVPPVVLGGSYQYARQIYQTNPATGTQILEPEFNAMEFGVKRVI